MTNETVQLLQSHRSIRRYTDQAIPQEMQDQLMQAAQWAPSSHHVQAYSIIVVRSAEKKQRLAELCAQTFIGTCPLLLVFCADFHRLKLASEMHGTAFALGEPEDLLVGAVDTALAAQNVMVAARSFGLGGVMIGGIRNQPEEVSALLDLPKYVVPIMGMCLGFPAEEPLQKPRLPQQVVVQQDSYQIDGMNEGLEEYEARSAAYYAKRTNGKQTAGWTKQMAAYFQEPRRANIREFVEKQGLLVKRD